MGLVRPTKSNGLTIPLRPFDSRPSPVAAQRMECVGIVSPRGRHIFDVGLRSGQLVMFLMKSTSRAHNKTTSWEYSTRFITDGERWAPIGWRESKRPGAIGIISERKVDRDKWLGTDDKLMVEEAIRQFAETNNL